MLCRDSIRAQPKIWTPIFWALTNTSKLSASKSSKTQYLLWLPNRSNLRNKMLNSSTHWRKELGVGVKTRLLWAYKMDVPPLGTSQLSHQVRKLLPSTQTPQQVSRSSVMITWLLVVHSEITKKEKTLKVPVWISRQAWLQIVVRRLVALKVAGKGRWRRIMRRCSSRLTITTRISPCTCARQRSWQGVLIRLGR